MFSKKTCNRCGKKTSKDNNFCPSCGTSFGKTTKKEEYGLLGKNDSFNELDNFSNSIFGLNGSFMSKMIASTMKMMEKEMEKSMKMNKEMQGKNKNSMPKARIRMMINGKEINLGEKQTQPDNKEKKADSIKFSRFTEEQAKLFSNLPKKEPKTDLKRIADKLTYEIEIPGVDSVDNVSIVNLENSLEMKAIGKDKAYTKSIPINLPIIGYGFDEGILILEFKGN